ncbi:MAG: ATP-dependent Clp protease adaptor ClpS [Bacteroidota bacterium]|jgi:ATP-dependent Clp protease adaptor protein ClpS|uniref:ATP-dependent Clp protease adaptor ClpS n=1 Tax=Candidatus Pollutiaquabacter sp. TaxID=3416354 RepID=UPI001B56D5D3|nr:ATP-dependent Clp protease adaptor ClpS [Bacteroidota bacterium]MBP6009147.1 ATP-dependent Clp protease adaptor ClpS [Bacteroidia bacterium]MBP7771065.1 ATP-dependent Clp protease adaptor ClpS [Bacteroidia bacterium]HPD53878.1 ATP-dependent Clp protease adaptor ClpS [Bacteroidia bacterium]
MIRFQNEGELAFEELVDNKTEEVRVRDLVLYNDDVNTFDFVIQCLIEVCKHDALQAEQCTYIVHYNGKCTVKTGSYLQLNPMRQALLDRGLSAVID